jgi:hypothetical protein
MLPAASPREVAREGWIVGSVRIGGSFFGGT